MNSESNEEQLSEEDKELLKILDVLEKYDLYQNLDETQALEDGGDE